MVSGGLDSATCLAIAKDRGFECYKQRHDYEITASKNIIASYSDISHIIFDIDLTRIGGSALTDSSINVPSEESSGIPITYVPARNTVFLSYALAWAEVLNADAIFIGVNALDYSGYPDCRPEYIEAFQTLINLATKVGVEGAVISLETPLIDLTKAEIIGVGLKLGVNYAATVSCYQADAEGRACGLCDSCRLRTKGFADAQSQDPTRYR